MAASHSGAMTVRNKVSGHHSPDMSGPAQLMEYMVLSFSGNDK
jgi:hypothetical protein